MVACFVSEWLNLKLKQQQPEAFINYCIDTCDLYLFPPLKCMQRCIASIELRNEWEKRNGERLYSKTILHFITNLSVLSSSRRPSPRARVRKSFFLSLVSKCLDSEWKPQQSAKFVNLHLDYCRESHKPVRPCAESYADPGVRDNPGNRPSFVIASLRSSAPYFFTRTAKEAEEAAHRWRVKPEAEKTETTPVMSQALGASDENWCVITSLHTRK